MQTTSAAPRSAAPPARRTPNRAVPHAFSVLVVVVGVLWFLAPGLLLHIPVAGTYLSRAYDALM